MIPGAGGVRKLCWALERRGKRGGARVVYCFHNESLPLCALTAYAKNERSDLPQSGPQRLPPADGASGRELREEDDAMTRKVADSIRQGLEEALAYAEGETDASRYRVRVPELINVKAIRAKLGMTQEQFAGRFGFSIKTLRHWEQGLRVPEGPARAYLLVIDRNPKAVEEALRLA